ncbi:MAG TPA: hypothetical protein H9821_06100 [Candidatus Rothia avicola]|uniref:Uncharacterized protein n=1 Tax=Candidatus Rothia avicola TaxID=2840478 RepID=A0A9D2CR55_9MICC|nr:hypothetical protein [Candidatus Rothia avicola]
MGPGDSCIYPDGNAVVPTVRTAERSFVASAASAPQTVAELIEASGK